MDYFVSANILLVKSVIVGKYLRLMINREKEERKKDIFSAFEEMKNMVNKINAGMLNEKFEE